MEKVLGKISSVYFGIGGQLDARIGLHLSFCFGGGGCNTSICAWDAEIMECSPYAKWTEEDRDKAYVAIMRKVSLYLNQAKVNDVSSLKGIPVEVTLEDGTLKSWRILEEVL